MLARQSATSATIPALLRASALQGSDRPAITGVHDQAVTYGSLVHLVEWFGSWLRTKGIGSGQVVALALPNGPLLAALQVAVASVAECAPLNPASATPEVEYLLTDLAADALLVEAGHSTRASEAASRLGVPLIEVSTTVLDPVPCAPVWSGAALSPRDPSLTRDPADVALRLHTSGTTGLPKQVPLTHGNLFAAATAVVDSLDLTEADRCLNVMPLFHSHGLIGALLSTLASGGTICCTPGLDPRRFLEWANLSGATWYTAAPTVHRTVLAGAGDHEGFRFIRSASAPLPTPLSQALEERFTAPVIEVYGMTEAYQIAANPLPPRERRAGTVGLPTGTRLALLRDGEITRSGEGEILVRGDNVFGGYASPPEASRDAFAAGWFRTGDLGEFDAEGYLRITGRLKEQINRGGEKISPREVDDALLTHPEVLDALSFSIPDEALGEDVAAAVVTRSGLPIDTAALRRHLAAQLAPFKVPRRVVFVDSIPLGPGGKPSRRILRDQAIEELHVSPPRRSPELELRPGSILEDLANLWAVVLGLPELPSVDDHFFDLGGSSLDVMELVTRVEEQIGVDLPLDDVLDLPTLGAMAAEVERMTTGHRSATHRHLSVMRAGGSDTAVVLIPGAHGVAIGLKGIAEYVADGPTVLGFRYPGHLPGETPLDTIEGLASLLIHELGESGARRLVLYGNSLGSWVAFETARRLAVDGHEVRGVILGDMYCPTLGRSDAAHRPPVLRRIAARARSTSRRLLAVRTTARPSVGLAEKRRQLVFRASNKALDKYRGAPYDGSVALLTTSLRASRLQRPTYGWDDLVRGEVSVAAVAGDHEELHTRHAAVIAEQINAHLV